MVLPRRGTNPVPNLEHLILIVLLLAAAFASYRAYESLYPGPLPHLGWAGLGGACFLGFMTYHMALAGRSKARPSAAG